jgi:leader peptidase (prepilin peptidase) / N-methyltransferase
MSIFVFKLIYSFIVGLFVGSFLNVCILRIPEEKSVVKPRSHCPKCGKTLRWYMNIPVASYLYLRGRCAYCRAKISKRYPLIEILTGILFAVVIYIYPDEWQLWPAFLYFMCALIVSTFTDLDHWIIPDLVTLPGIVVGLVSAALAPQLIFWPHLIGAIFGGGIFMVVNFVYLKIAHKDGIGGGDVKFLAMVGAILGFTGALGTLILSSLVGSILGIALILMRKVGGKSALPFGPFLALGALCTFLFGDLLWKWYFQLL